MVFPSTQSEFTTERISFVLELFDATSGGAARNYYYRAAVLKKNRVGKTCDEKEFLLSLGEITKMSKRFVSGVLR